MYTCKSYRGISTRGAFIIFIIQKIVLVLCTLNSNGTRRKQFNVRTTEREIHTATIRTPEGPSCTVMQNICEPVTDIYYYASDQFSLDCLYP